MWIWVYKFAGWFSCRCMFLYHVLTWGRFRPVPVQWNSNRDQHERKQWINWTDFWLNEKLQLSDSELDGMDSGAVTPQTWVNDVFLQDWILWENKWEHFIMTFIWNYHAAITLAWGAFLLQLSALLMSHFIDVFTFFCIFFTFRCWWLFQPLLLTCFLFTALNS